MLTDEVSASDDDDLDLEIENKSAVYVCMCGGATVNRRAKEESIV